MRNPAHLENIRNESAWLIQKECSLTPAQFMMRATALAKLLPAKKYVILICNHWLNFFTSFVAAQLRGQTVLLPSNRSIGAIKEIVADYPDAYYLTDDDTTIPDLETFYYQNVVLEPESEYIEFNIDFDNQHIAAIVFTSGSTGKPSANIKTWGSLVRGARLAAKRFKLTAQHTIVATVPAQHMYGLETTVMLPLVAGISVFTERPFYPESIREALTLCSNKCVLVTTPIHLRACVAAGLTWPEINQIISATAPLCNELRDHTIATFSVPLREIYGCTETGAMASRESSIDESWRLYDGFRLCESNGNYIARAPHLDVDEVILSDQIKILGPNKFLLLGRNTDMLNIAGKRASLADLNMKLNAIPGVIDGIIFMPDHCDDAKVCRLAGLVVTDNLNISSILSSLSQQIDAAFLPRPLYIVNKLPRNETGKLPRQNLLSFFKKISCQQ